MLLNGLLLFNSLHKYIKTYDAKNRQETKFDGEVYKNSVHLPIFNKI